MTRLLAAVTRAARKRAEAEAAYRAAIAAARETHTMPQIARAAGLTKQGVSYLLRPDPRKDKR